MPCIFQLTPISTRRVHQEAALQKIPKRYGGDTKCTKYWRKDVAEVYFSLWSPQSGGCIQPY
ncbi:hypothetical protein [Algicola sagamiensis]|uniref:hypothetical protein n=1 Tax=Algicola sagamiensis TaxID=163869 RepID=UPI0003AA8B77|nr:hypothetical protein [Algicola sagamiensis]